MKRTSRLLQIFIWESKKEVIINTIGQANSSVNSFWARIAILIINKKEYMRLLVVVDMQEDFSEVHYGSWC